MTKEQSYTRFWEGSKRMWITFLFFSFIMIGFVQAANTAFAQTTVTVNVQDATLSDVLWEIQRQTDFTFIYSTNDVKNVKVRNLRVTNGKIAAVLDECLKNSGLAYVVKDGAIAIRPANEVNAVKAVEQANVISGTVVDETGEPVIGANVLVKGTTNGQITDLNGGFSIKVEHASATLLVSYVGYVRQEVKATSGKILKIVLVPDANMMEEVVVTGYNHLFHHICIRHQYNLQYLTRSSFHFLTNIANIRDKQGSRCMLHLDRETSIQIGNLAVCSTFDQNIGSNDGLTGLIHHCSGNNISLFYCLHSIHFIGWTDSNGPVFYDISQSAILKTFIQHCCDFSIRDPQITYLDILYVICTINESKIRLALNFP